MLVWNGKDFNLVLNKIEYLLVFGIVVRKWTRKDSSQFFYGTLSLLLILLTKLEEGEIIRPLPEGGAFLVLYMFLVLVLRQHVKSQI